MTQNKNTTNLERMLFQFMDTQDPMLSMLEWYVKRLWKWKFLIRLAQISINKVKQETVTAADFVHAA